MFVNNYFSATKSAKSCRIFLVVVFLMFVAAKTAAANEGDFYIVYEFNDVVRTPSDHRERYTQVRVYKSGDVAFRDRDEIFGCTDKIVHEMNLFNEDAAKITKEEVAYLKEALVEAKVFDLVSDPMPPGFFDVRPMQEPAHYANLEVNIDGREKRFEFYTNPRSFDRAAVHKVMFDFVTRLKLDQPPSDSRAIIVSEGDLEPSQSVQLAEVLSNPEEYHGKRISIVGYRHLEFEGNRICLDKRASEESDKSKCIWSGHASTLVNSGRFAAQDDTVQEIEGVFKRGPAGHFGAWPGSIERITRTKIIIQ